MQINEQDLIYLKNIRKVLDKSKIELEGAAVKTVASLFIWFDSFEKRMTESLKQDTSPKEVKNLVEKL